MQTPANTQPPCLVSVGENRVWISILRPSTKRELTSASSNFSVEAHTFVLQLLCGFFFKSLLVLICVLGEGPVWYIDPKTYITISEIFYNTFTLQNYIFYLINKESKCMIN